MWRSLALIGLLPVLLAADFPASIYDHVTKNATCASVPSDCGVGSEATCSGAGAPCLYTATKMNHVGDEVEAIETALGVNLANVLTPSAIDTSAELAAIVTNETGTGALVFGTGPTLSGPVIGATTVAGLPSAGTKVGAIYVVTDYDTSCNPSPPGGGGGKLMLCRDNGSSYDPFDANVAASIGTGDEPYCMPIDGLQATFDHKMVVAWPTARSVKSYGCRCNGTCTTLAQLWLEDSAHNAIGASYVTCSTGNITFTDVTSDSDGDLASGEPLEVFTNNTPVPETDEYLLCVTFE